MLTCYNQEYKREEFTHEGLIMSKLLDFLPMMIESYVKNGLKLLMNYLLYKEKPSFIYIYPVHNS